MGTSPRTTIKDILAYQTMVPFYSSGILFWIALFLPLIAAIILLAWWKYRRGSLGQEGAIDEDEMDGSKISEQPKPSPPPSYTDATNPPPYSVLNQGFVANEEEEE